MTVNHASTTTDDFFSRRGPHLEKNPTRNLGVYAARAAVGEETRVRLAFFFLPPPFAILLGACGAVGARGDLVMEFCEETPPRQRDVPVMCLKPLCTLALGAQTSHFRQEFRFLEFFLGN